MEPGTTALAAGVEVSLYAVAIRGSIQHCAWCLSFVRS